MKIKSTYKTATKEPNPVDSDCNNISSLCLPYTTKQTEITTEILYSSDFGEMYFTSVPLPGNPVASSLHATRCQLNFYTSYQETLTSSSSSFSSMFASLLALSRTAAIVLPPSVAATPGRGGNPVKERNTEERVA